jgi:hypothetical protein
MPNLADATAVCSRPEHSLIYGAGAAAMGRSGPDRGPSSVSGNAYRYRLRRACSCVLSKGSSARSARRGSSGPTMVRQPARIITSKLSTQRILHSPSRPDANRPAPALPQPYGSSIPCRSVSGVMPTDQDPLCLSPVVRVFQVVRGQS